MHLELRVSDYTPSTFVKRCKVLPLLLCSSGKRKLQLNTHKLPI